MQGTSRYGPGDQYLNSLLCYDFLVGGVQDYILIHGKSSLPTSPVEPDTRVDMASDVISTTWLVLVLFGSGIVV